MVRDSGRWTSIGVRCGSCNQKLAALERNKWKPAIRPTSMGTISEGVPESGAEARAEQRPEGDREIHGSEVLRYITCGRCGAEYRVTEAAIDEAHRGAVQARVNNVTVHPGRLALKKVS
jgi:hypothetical protein